MVEEERRAKRQQKIVNLLRHGYTNQQISEVLEYPLRQVAEDVKIIKFHMQPKTVRSIEYSRNVIRDALRSIKKDAFDFFNDINNKETARVAALRVRLDAEKLQAQVDGAITEKVTFGPEKKSEELQRKLVAIASQKDKGNGHEEKEDGLVKDAVTDEGAEEANTG